jgi:hypothetical protein
MSWNPFSRHQKSDSAADHTSDSSASTQTDSLLTDDSRTPKKGRPTPKRKKAQALEYRPLVPSVADRRKRHKEEKKIVRARQDAEYEAMEKGDLAHMPRSEQLPIRVYVRDYVDARHNLAEWFLPVVLIVLVLAMAAAAISPIISNIMTALMYVYMIACIIDLMIMWLHGLKPKLIDKYGQASIKATHSMGYAVSRAMQVRKWRVPKPRHDKRGVWPR